jgi:hypothetical protein
MWQTISHLFARLTRLRVVRADFRLGWFDAWAYTGLVPIAGGVDTASYDEALKTVYEDRIVQLLPNTLKLYGRAEERDAKQWGGRHVEYAIQTRRNAGVGAYAEMGAIPEAGAQGYANVRIPMRYLSGRIQLSAQVIEASRASKMAYVPAMQSEMDGLMRDLRHECGRMIHGDGRGVLAFQNGDSTTTTVIVDSPGGVAGAANGSRFIPLGGRITFVTPATGAIVAAADELVTAIASTGLNFTTGSTIAGAVADNDYIVRANKAGLTDISDTGYAKEPMGIRGLADDGTYVATLCGVNRTTVPLFSSYVISGTGGLSSDVLQRGLDVADQRGEGNVEELVMHHSVRRAYIGLTDGDRRYTTTDLSKPDAGTVAAKKGKLTFGGIPILEDKFCDYGTIYGMDYSSFVRYVESPGKWMRSGHDEGTVLQAIGSGSTLTHAYEAVWYLWQNFMLDKPNSCVVWRDVTATVTSLHID